MIVVQNPPVHFHDYLKKQGRLSDPFGKKKNVLQGKSHFFVRIVTHNSWGKSKVLLALVGEIVFVQKVKRKTKARVL